MKKHLIIITITLSFLSCITLKPIDFTYQYTEENTGLDSLIDINGYYISQRACDSTFFSIFKFYPDGLFIIATGTDLTEVVLCLENDINKNKTVCKYPSWGVYRICGDTIKTQTIREEGIGFCIILRDYKISPNKTISNISDYVISENSNMGYMRNYPSFKENTCHKTATFTPSKEVTYSLKCPYLNKKWFRNK